MIPASYLVNSILYIIMVFTAGLIWDRRTAVLLSIATAAVALLAADQFLLEHKRAGQAIAIASWAIGMAAATCLVWPK